MSAEPKSDLERAVEIAECARRKTDIFMDARTFRQLVDRALDEIEEKRAVPFSGPSFGLGLMVGLGLVLTVITILAACGAFDPKPKPAAVEFHVAPAVIWSSNEREI